MLVLTNPPVETAAPNMDISLGKWDLDAPVFEGTADREIQVAAEDTRDRCEFLGPNSEDEVQGTVSELLEQYRRGMTVKNARMRPRDLQENLTDLFGIGIVGDPHGKVEPHVAVRVTPVHDLRGDEIGVRYDNGDVVVRDDGGGARRNIDDVAVYLADFDAIADFDGAFQQQDDAADEVVGNALKAEPDSDAQRAEEDRQGAEVDPGGLEDDDQAQADDDITRNGAHRMPYAKIDVAVAEQPFNGPGLDLARDIKERDGDERQVHDRS